MTTCAPSIRYINLEEEGYVGGFHEAAIHGMLAAVESDFEVCVRSFIPNAAGNVSVVAPDGERQALTTPLVRRCRRRRSTTPGSCLDSFTYFRGTHFWYYGLDRLGVQLRGVR